MPNNIVIGHRKRIERENIVVSSETKTYSQLLLSMPTHVQVALCQIWREYVEEDYDPIPTIIAPNFLDPKRTIYVYQCIASECALNVNERVRKNPDLPDVSAERREMLVQLSMASLRDVEVARNAGVSVAVLRHARHNRKVIARRLTQLSRADNVMKHTNPFTKILIEPKREEMFGLGCVKLDDPNDPVEKIRERVDPSVVTA